MAKDWSRFTKRITAESTTRAIYNAWTLPDELERWFLAKARFSDRNGQARMRADRAATGDGYEWTWYGYKDGSPESGTVIEANGHDFFSFTFAEESVVEISIGSEGGEKVIELTQKNIGPDDNLHVYIGCGEGWVFYLANLKSYLENGVDLRNRNDDIGRLVNS